MPGSDSNQIPAIMKLVSEAQPASILDVGVGWGKYGALFRMCLESGYANLSDRRNWKIRIDGVEAFPEYIGAIQQAIYNHIFLEPIEQVLPKLGDYDLIFMGDVIEHFPKEKGRQLLEALLARAQSRLILSTPNGPYSQGDILGNPFERHQSYWEIDDFLSYPHVEVYANKKSIIAVLSRFPIQQAGRRWTMGGYRRQPWTAALGAYLRYRWQRCCKQRQKAS